MAIDYSRFQVQAPRTNLQGIQMFNQAMDATRQRRAQEEAQSQQRAYFQGLAERIGGQPQGLSVNYDANIPVDAPSQGGLTYQTPLSQDQRTALIEYTLMNPQAGKEMIGALQSMNAMDQDRNLMILEGRARDAEIARNIEDPEQRNAFLMQRATELDNIGLNSMHTRQLAEMPYDMQNLALDRARIETVSALDLSKERGLMDRLIKTKELDAKLSAEKDQKAQGKILRAEINSRLKDYKKTEAAFNRMNSIFENDPESIAEFKKKYNVNVDEDEMMQSALNFGDIALVFSYMKMLDPESAVREGEQATVQNAGNVPTWVINTYNKLRKGEFLNDAQKQGIRYRADKFYSAARDDRNKTLNDYRRLGERLNVPSELFILESQEEVEEPINNTPNETIPEGIDLDEALLNA